MRAQWSSMRKHFFATAWNTCVQIRSQRHHIVTRYPGDCKLQSRPASQVRWIVIITFNCYHSASGLWSLLPWEAWTVNVIIQFYTYGFPPRYIERGAPKVFQSIYISAAKCSYTEVVYQLGITWQTTWRRCNSSHKWIYFTTVKEAPYTNKHGSYSPISCYIHATHPNRR